MKKAFPSFVGRRLTSGPRPKLAQPASRARLASLSPAQRRAAPCLPPRACPLTRRAACPDRGRACSPRGDHASASPAARQPWPDPAAMRPPSPAEASALAGSFPRCLSSPPEPSAPTLPLAAPTHPPAKSAAAPPLWPAITRPQLRLALLQVVLAFAPPVELR